MPRVAWEISIVTAASDLARAAARESLAGASAREIAHVASTKIVGAAVATMVDVYLAMRIVSVLGVVRGGGAAAARETANRTEASGRPSARKPVSNCAPEHAEP